MSRIPLAASAECQCDLRGREYHTSYSLARSLSLFLSLSLSFLFSPEGGGADISVTDVSAGLFTQLVTTPLGWSVTHNT